MVESKEIYLNNIYSISEHYSEKYNKHIYIFGEKHDRDKPCQTRKHSINVDKFIIDTINNESKNKNIDFYLETPYISKTYNKEVKYKSNIQFFNIPNFQNYYKDCFQYNKKDCIYKNVRFHYTDIRKPDFVNDQIFLFELKLFIRHIIRLPINDQFEILLKHNEEINEYKKLNNIKDFMEYGLKTYSKLKILKNLESVSYPEVKILLLKHLEECLSKLDLNILKWNNIMEIVNYLIKQQEHNKKINEIDIDEDDLDYGSGEENEESDDEDNKIKRSKEQKIFEEYNKYHEKLVLLDETLTNYNVCFMDVYLISRMFRKFSDSTHKKDIYSEEPKNIIIFVGDTHAENYRKFLKELKFKQIFYIKDDKNCLNISGLKLPLFSK